MQGRADDVLGGRRFLFTVTERVSDIRTTELRECVRPR